LVRAQSLETTKSAEDAKSKNDDWLAHGIYFIRDALLFCEFEKAVATADAGCVIRVLKYWCFVKWKYETHGALRRALEQSWFVNRWGLGPPNRGEGVCASVRINTALDDDILSSKMSAM